MNHELEKKLLGKTDILVSKIGFGCAFSLSNSNDFKTIINAAYQRGINYFDVSPFYGKGLGEVALGKALESFRRSDFYVASKVGRYSAVNSIGSEFDFSASKILQSIDQSIEKLNCSYLDVCQLHDIEFCPSIDQILNESLPALEEAKRKGKIRYIGISGYPLEYLKEVIEKSHVKIDTVLTYCHLNIHDNSLFNYLDFFTTKGVGVINASVNSMGLLTPKGAPCWHPASNELRDICSKLIEDLNENHQISITDLSLRYGLSFNQIDCTLTSSLTIEELNNNFKNLSIPFSEHEMSVFSQLRHKYFKNSNFSWEKC